MRGLFILLSTDVASCWLLPALAPRSVIVTSPLASRCAHAHCSDDGVVLPPEVTDAIPPEKLSDAWMRDEKAKELSDVLQGCSLYLVGLGPKKTAVGRVLARRLSRYRCYDIGTLMASTYQQLSGSEEGAESVTLAQLVSAEPLADVEQLAGAVLQQVQAFSRSVFVTWDGAVSTSDFAVMQQGIVVHITQDDPGAVALPAEGADEALKSWKAGHRKADITVSLEADDAADDAAFLIVDSVLEFIESNPAKSQEWKAQADAKLASGQSDGM